MVELPIPRFVKIIAKAADASAPVFGTGFRLGPRRVLTALHVVKGARNIEVQDKEGARWQTSKAECIWPEPAADTPLDVAVLATEPAKEVKTWSRFADKALTVRLQWDSTGFPVTRKGQRDPRGIFGTAIEFSDDATRFELTVGEGIPDDVDDWQGISGAPVFIEGFVHGVIVQGPRVFRGERLDAIPLSALLKLEDFRRALSDPEADVFQDDDFYVEQVERLLRHSEAVCLEIAQQDEEWLPLSALPDKQRARVMAEVICRESQMGRVAVCLSDAYCNLVERSAMDAAAAVLDIMNHALPAACLNHPPSPMSDAVSNHLELAVTTEIMAEIVLAAIERRPMRLNPPTNPHRHFPVPELQVPSVKKLLGIDPRGAQEAFLIAQEIENRIVFDTQSGQASPEVLKFIARLPGHNSFLFPKTLLNVLDRLPEEKRQAAVIQIINGRLADEAKHRGRFFLITEPSPDYDKAFHHNLRGRLTELRQVTLSGDLDQLAKDEQTNRAIQRVYIQRALGKETSE